MDELRSVCIKGAENDRSLHASQLNRRHSRGRLAPGIHADTKWHWATLLRGFEATKVSKGIADYRTEAEPNSQSAGGCQMEPKNGEKRQGNISAFFLGELRGLPAGDIRHASLLSFACLSHYIGVIVSTEFHEH